MLRSRGRTPLLQSRCYLRCFTGGSAEEESASQLTLGWIHFLAARVYQQIHAMWLSLQVLSQLGISLSLRDSLFCVCWRMKLHLYLYLYLSSYSLCNVMKLNHESYHRLWHILLVRSKAHASFSLNQRMWMWQSCPRVCPSLTVHPLIPNDSWNFHMQNTFTSLPRLLSLILVYCQLKVPIYQHSNLVKVWIRFLCVVPLNAATNTVHLFLCGSV